MGLLANIFGNGNTVKNREKNRSRRICRIEELEPRVMLTGTPWTAPTPPDYDPINIGIVFHDSAASHNLDTFTVSWKGGENEGKDTKLSELVIDLNQGLSFKGDVHFETSGVEDWRIGNEGKQLFIKLSPDFTENQLVFSVSVERVSSISESPTSVYGQEFQGSTITATFTSKNFENYSVDPISFMQMTSDSLPVLDDLDLPYVNLHMGDPANHDHTAFAMSEWDGELTLKTGTLSGIVYEAIDTDSKKDTSAGIAGAKVQLWKWCDVEEDYVILAGEATTSDGSDGKPVGSYEFTNVDAFNKYQIVVVECEENGYNCWFASVGTLEEGFNGKKQDANTINKIVMFSAEDGENYNFAKYKGAIISGHVYVDVDESENFNMGDIALGGVTIELLRWNGDDFEVVAETATDKVGRYEFGGLKPGEYIVRIKEDEHPDRDRYECWVVNIGEDVIRSQNNGDTDLDVSNPIAIASGDEKTDHDFGKLEQTTSPAPPHECPPPCDCPTDEPGCGCTPPDEPNCGCPTDEPECGCTPPGEPVCNCPPPEEPSCGCPTDEPECGCTPPGEPVCGCPTDDPGCGCTPTDPPVEPPPPPPPPPPVDPPVTPPGTPVTPPSFGFVPTSPVGGAGAFASPGAVAWNAPFIGEQLRAGFGSGAVAAQAPAFSWHLSVINAGYPRANGATDGIAVGEHASKTTMILSDAEGNPAEGARYVSVSWTPLPTQQSGWYVRGKDGVVRKRFTFGPDGGIPVVGDFSGDGIAKVAVFHEGNWYIDINGNGVWDEEDLWAEMGSAGDQPVAGDWDGDGKTDIGIFGPMRAGDHQMIAATPGLPTDLNPTVSAQPKNMPPDINIRVSMNNVRAMKHSQGGGVRLDVSDHVFQYGNQGDIGFTGDFTGDGIATIGVYRNGKWFIDRTGTGKWDENAVLVNNADFGLGSGGIPVIGDFNGDGIDKIGLYVDGVWYLDTTGDFKFDTRIEFGEAGDYPVVGDFDGTGIAQLAVYRASTNENPLVAGVVPEPVMGTGAGIFAREFGSDSDSQPDQEALKHQGRTVSTPHTNAPLLRGK